jgi:hypothetical protein
MAEVKWFTASAALDAMAYKTEKEIFEKGLNFLKPYGKKE